VAFTGREHVYGIVARELVDPDQPGESPRDRRSPDAIRRAFHGFLDEMQKLGMQTVYVPLLAAGSRQVFRPWMSVVQMARAYGEWHRAQVGNGAAPDSLVDVEVCTDDPGVIAMLQGNYIDLSESLEAAHVSLTVEIIHEDNEVLRYHRIVDGTDTLSDILPNVDSIGTPYPAVYALPAVHRQRPPPDFLKSIAKTVEDFGLVSGSTLVLDFRTSQREDQPGVGQADVNGPTVTPGVTHHAARPRP
jgi:hypothetical protein